MNLDDIKRRLGPLWTQLRTGSGTEGADCACVGACNVDCMSSKGKVGPVLQNGPPSRFWDTVAGWVRRIRRIANNQSGPMMVRGDLFEYLNSDAHRQMFRDAGLRPPTATYQYGIEFWKIRKWLSDSDDHAVLLAIDYSVARADGCPVGSNTFGGGHIVMLTGAQRRRVRTVSRSGRIRYPLRWKTVMGDSLMDGRAMPGGGHYGKSWQIVRLYKYRRAAGAFGTAPNGSPRPIGKGRAVAIFVERND